MFDDANDDDSAASANEDIREGAAHPVAPFMIWYSHDGGDERAWISDTQTQTVVWRPKDVLLMAWLRGGTEVAVIGQTFTPNPQKSPIIGSRLQSELDYWFERWTWPDRQRLSHCLITMRTGWPMDILPTPDPNLVFFEWYDQGEAGYEGIALNDASGDKQEPTESYELGFLDDVSSVRFSDDARYLVRCYGRHVQNHVPCEWEQIAVVAQLNIVDRAAQTVYDMPLMKSIPANWQPITIREGQQWVQSCEFTDATHVVVQLADGTSATISVEAPDLTALPVLPPHPSFKQAMPDREDAATKAAIDAHYQRMRESGKRLQHPHEAVYIGESSEQGVYPSKQYEWVADADGQIIWDLGDALIMTWLFNGTQIGVIRGAHFHYYASEPQRLAFERWSWPERTLISRLSLDDWAGEPRSLMVSPRGTMLSIIWLGETQWLYRLAITPDGTPDQTIAKTHYIYNGKIVAQTSDDACLVVLERESFGWPSHAPMFAHPWRMLAGTLIVFDEPHQSIREIPLLANFPANWTPDLAGRRSPDLPWFYQTGVALITDARLVDDEMISIRFATGKERLVPIDPFANSPAPPPVSR